MEQMIDQVTTMARQFGLEEALSWIIGGRDCMLIPRAELDSAVGQLTQLVCCAEVAGDLVAVVGLNKVLGYSAGIQHARLSLQAAGIEVAA